MTGDLSAINFPTSRSIYRWLPSAWLRVHGPDAFTFLQGQFTNDLRLLAGQAAVYGLWLGVKGKVMADSFVLRGGQDDEFLIGSYRSTAGVIRERLESHIIADEVAVADVTAEWAGITVFGGSAVSPPGAVKMFLGRRIRDEHCEWMFRLDDRARIEAELGGAVELDFETMERQRIMAGIPAIPDDVGAADLPGEGGLEADAISYTKGCYLGQEVMARLKSMGQVRRRLLRVRGAGADFPARLPARLFLAEREVGELRSAARDGDGFVGLAMLTLMHVSPGAALGFESGRPARLTLVDSP